MNRIVYRFHDYELDPARLELRRGCAPIKLDPLCFSLLRYLVENGDRVVSKDELLSEIWQNTAVVEAVLPTCIGRIRRALGESARGEGAIETLHRRGYRLRHPVTIVGRPSIRLDSRAAESAASLHGAPC